MSIQVKELAFVFHSVTDVPRARKFYEALLGLKLGMQVELAPGKWWIEYDIAGQALAITNMMSGKPASAVALEVADLTAALKAAEGAAYKIVTPIADYGQCRMFQVADADGNEITLHQRKAKPDGVEKI
jgi:predicted enzyme related to lactoylglutathione lyase